MDKTIVAMSKTLFSHKAEAVIQETDFRLSNLDFSVKQGELIGIIGKVGSGKSSLLTSILGMDVDKKKTACYLSNEFFS